VHYANHLREGYDAPNEMLDDFMKKFGLEKQDWSKGHWGE
jgi:hypothetical protein